MLTLDADSSVHTRLLEGEDQDPALGTYKYNSTLKTLPAGTEDLSTHLQYCIYVEN